ncbi:hypothetical protein J8273_1685 [Carpediemonas membranifera]|uniref:VWFA domain-containing protein n=1 Tax=Carpediemonas membranifera TaxID=201153 RepID=A0A8J6E646_9EUKA|nr:hypothetical protein J8273_1685 [Carpediemonas membranifera]|eukprot:KAG9396667.1 hypothetical protein J8273_1685 [Carpediemonas membranifera]
MASKNAAFLLFFTLIAHTFAISFSIDAIANITAVITTYMNDLVDEAVSLSDSLVLGPEPLADYEELHREHYSQFSAQLDSWTALLDAYADAIAENTSAEAPHVVPCTAIEPSSTLLQVCTASSFNSTALSVALGTIQAMTAPPGNITVILESGAYGHFLPLNETAPALSGDVRLSAQYSELVMSGGRLVAILVDTVSVDRSYVETVINTFVQSVASSVRFVIAPGSTDLSQYSDTDFTQAGDLTAARVSDLLDAWSWDQSTTRTTLESAFALLETVEGTPGRPTVLVIADGIKQSHIVDIRASAFGRTSSTPPRTFFVTPSAVTQSLLAVSCRLGGAGLTVRQETVRDDLSPIFRFISLVENQIVGAQVSGIVKSGPFTHRIHISKPLLIAGQLAGVIVLSTDEDHSNVYFSRLDPDSLFDSVKIWMLEQPNVAAVTHGSGHFVGDAPPIRFELYDDNEYAYVTRVADITAHSVTITQNISTITEYRLPISNPESESVCTFGDESCSGTIVAYFPQAESGNPANLNYGLSTVLAGIPLPENATQHATLSPDGLAMAAPATADPTVYRGVYTLVRMQKSPIALHMAGMTHICGSLHHGGDVIYDLGVYCVSFDPARLAWILTQFDLCRDNYCAVATILGHTVVATDGNAGYLDEIHSAHMAGLVRSGFYSNVTFETDAVHGFAYVHDSINSGVANGTFCYDKTITAAPIEITSNCLVIAEPANTTSVIRCSAAAARSITRTSPGIVFVRPVSVVTSGPGLPDKDARDAVGAECASVHMDTRDMTLASTFILFMVLWLAQLGCRGRPTPVLLLNTPIRAKRQGNSDSESDNHYSDSVTSERESSGDRPAESHSDSEVIAIDSSDTLSSSVGLHDSELESAMVLSVFPRSTRQDTETETSLDDEDIDW